MKALITILTLFMLPFSLLAQSQLGTIRGKVLDANTGEALPFVNAILTHDSIVVGGASSDFDGKFMINAIAPGTYDLEVKTIGFASVRTIGVQVRADQITFLEVEMEEQAQLLKEIEVVSYQVPLISRDAGASGGTISRVRSGMRRSGAKAMRKDRRRNKAEEKLLENVSQPEVKAGTLTAGEIHDLSKWKLWSDVKDEALSKHVNTWEMTPQQRYTVQVTNPDGWPLGDVKVRLENAMEETIWEGRTDPTGKVDLWSGFRNGEEQTPHLIIASINDQQESIDKVKPFEKGLNRIILEADCQSSSAVDILFAVDATGSMDDEIEFLKTDLQDVITQAQQKHEDLDLHLGSVFYRCPGNDYVTKRSPFTKDFKEAISFMQEQEADEGGLEALEQALHVAVNEMHWRDEARVRMLFLVLDEHPGSDPKTVDLLHSVTRQAAAKGIRIIPVVASGENYDDDKSLEYLTRCLAMATNGTYTFLTDHSGVGNTHTEPSTDRYEVEALNALMLRLIDQFTAAEDCQSVPSLLDDELVWPEIVEQQVALSNGVNGSELKETRADINVFPNPSSGSFSVQVKGKAKQLYVADQNGRILSVMDMNEARGRTHQFDLSALSNGIYLVVAVFNKDVVSKPVIIQH